MTSQIETMFTSLRSKIDEEYSRIMTTFHQDISTNLSPDDFTQDYGKVEIDFDLSKTDDNSFPLHPNPSDCWFIYKIKNGGWTPMHDGSPNFTISYLFDNYEQFFIYNKSIMVLFS